MTDKLAGVDKHSHFPRTYGKDNRNVPQDPNWRKHFDINHKDELPITKKGKLNRNSSDARKRRLRKRFK